jgi:hypothetical protein
MTPGTLHSKIDRSLTKAVQLFQQTTGEDGNFHNKRINTNTTWAVVYGVARVARKRLRIDPRDGQVLACVNHASSRPSGLAAIRVASGRWVEGVPYAVLGLVAIGGARWKFGHASSGCRKGVIAGLAVLVSAESIVHELEALFGVCP